MKKSGGRPPKMPGESNADYLDVRLKPAEKEAFQRAAEYAGLSLSAWVRVCLREASSVELTKRGQPVPFLEESSKAEEPS